METLIKDIIQWGTDKGITGTNGTGTVVGQLNKTQEELNETRDAAVSMGVLMQIFEGDIDSPLVKEHWTRFIDGIGDTVVTLILAADRAGLEFKECVQAAYDEIKNRTGKMEGGVFVKDSQVLISPPSEALEDEEDWDDLDATKACTLGDETCESCQ